MLVEYNPKIGKKRNFPNMEWSKDRKSLELDEKSFQKAFLKIKEIIEVMF